MSVLQDMINAAPEQLEALDSSLSQLQTQINNSNIEINGVETKLCNVAKNNLVSYLDGTKLNEVELLYSSSIRPFSIIYGSNFGQIDYINGTLSDFEILDSTGVIRYQMNGIGWDNDSLIIKLNTDFKFGNDYLTRPLTTGAVYGLIPTRDNLLNAKSILAQNRAKIATSVSVFGDYV